MFVFFMCVCVDLCDRRLLGTVPVGHGGLPHPRCFKQFHDLVGATFPSSRRASASQTQRAAHCPTRAIALATTRCTRGVLNATAQSRSRPSRTQLRHSEDMTSLLAITGIATTGSRHTTAPSTCRRDSWVQCTLLFSMMTVVTDRKAVKAGMRNWREQSAGAPPNSSHLASQRTVPPTSKTLVRAQHSRWRK